MFLRSAFVVLAFLSGSAALSHELLWTRRLIDLLGATQWVTGRVLGLFFLGLALGGWMASRWSGNEGSAAKRLGLAEFSIALFSLPALLLPIWADWIVASIGPDMLVSWQGSLIKLLLSIVVVLPPAIAMGTTMPLFMLVTTDLGGQVKQSGIGIYSINMIGGVFGLWLVSTFLLERMGVQGVMIGAACVNVVIGSTAILLAPKVCGKVPPCRMFTTGDEVASRRQSTADSTGLLLLSFVSGFFVLALEVLVLRLLALVAPSSFHTTSALLANVILFLSLGSVAVIVLNRIGISNRIQLIAGFVGSAGFCLFCPVILYHSTNKLVSLRYLVALEGQTIESMTQYWMMLFSTIAISGGATLLFAGLVFPTILSMSSRNDPAGKSIGKLLAVNGVGGLLGSELANGALMSNFGIYGGFVFLAIGLAAVAFVVCLIRRWGLSSIAIVVVVLALAIPAINSFRDLRYVSPRSKTRYAVEHTVFGPEGVLLVVNDQKNSKSILLNNQYILGSTGVASIERRQLLLPWMLYPEAKTVCCLGLATGISASGLEVLENPPAVTSIELSGNVAEVAKEFFRNENMDFFDRPDNRVVVEDARTFVAATTEEYDLIVADLFRPHGVGEGRLFSIEHFRNVKRALKSGGMFCQWLPAHQLNEKQFRMIAASFQAVFPESLIVMGGTLTRTPSIGLCAWRDGKTWETNDLIENIERIRTVGTVKDKLVLNAQLLICGVLKKDQYASEPLNTLNNSSLELEAGRFWVLKDLRSNRPADDLKNGFLSGANLKRFLIQIFEDSKPVLDPVHRKQLLQSLN